jgi:hypothetical protein
MAFHFRAQSSTAPNEPRAGRNAALIPVWSEQMVTVVAVSIGVVVVALIALLMGMD